MSEGSSKALVFAAGLCLSAFLLGGVSVLKANEVFRP